jgi:hypothetical protein
MDNDFVPFGGRVAFNSSLLPLSALTAKSGQQGDRMSL